MSYTTILLINKCYFS